MRNIKEQKTNEFAFKIYENEANKQIFRCLLAVVLLQFPVGCFLAFLKIFPLGPFVYIFNGIIGTFVLIIVYVLSKTTLYKIQKYIISLSLIGMSYIAIMSYGNYFPHTIIWFLAPIGSSIYLDKKIMIYVDMGTIIAIFIMNIFSPLNLPSPYLGEMISFYLLFLVSIILIYFIFELRYKMFVGIDKSMSSVKLVTSVVNHALKNELAIISLKTQIMIDKLDSKITINKDESYLNR